MINFRSALMTVILAAYLAPLSNGIAAPASAGQLALEAKEALDTYYGNQAQLTRAAELLSRAIAENKGDASVYVQAARLTIKGGHVVATQFRPGTVDAYGELLDRALSLDPRNSKAHILKAEYFHYKGDYVAERAALDKAQETGTKDAWLLVGYGRLYLGLGDVNRAFAYYSKARARGPEKSLEQRNAYVAALNGLAALAADSGDEKALRELIDATRRGRDSRDAWALGNLASSLLWAGMFDEAIALSREALRTMNYGAGRLTLTAALFAKAAELTLAGKHAAAAPLLSEARDYGYSKSAMSGHFNVGTAKVAPLLPILKTIIE